ncbi:hypothetical protein [Natronoglomus mannanivorans]|uniref:Uncharacterized protein n=1 Tax=Natronoglomus mannanivorans TaxID=2979990 RepID=A0AAP2Z1G8_9EURY|nr:hypothetical protein [Halobacteria archaeon AArc-xg1-1]
MDVRLPNVRDPRSFYDVFATIGVSTVVMAVVLSIWHGTFVRLEMIVFIGIVFLWGAWAINNILDRSTRFRGRR